MHKCIIALVLTALFSSGAHAQSNPLWHTEKVINYLPHMTWLEVEDLLSRTDMVIIPVPAIEQHGPQLPMGTDYYTGEELAKLIAQKTDVLVAPILLPGISPYHMEFPGTITLSADTVQRVYFEAVQSLIHHGFRRFLMLTSHAGNRVEMSRTGRNEVTLPEHLRKALPQVIAGDDTATTVLLAEALKPKDTGKHTSTREMTGTGVWSERDTREASAESGREDSEAFVDACVQFIERWRVLKPLEPLAKRRNY